MELKGALQRIYDGPLSRSDKLAKKEETIAAYEAAFQKDYLPRFQSSSYREARSLQLNNAFLSLYSLYTDAIPLLRRYETERCGSDLKVFVQKIKELAKGGGDMVDRVRRSLD